jgi:putative nucleotidyltransferase with HDIG domain
MVFLCYENGVFTNMKEYQIKELQPGMITAAPVMTPNGQVIVKENSELTNKMISRIDFYGIKLVQIQDIKAAPPPISSGTLAKPQTPDDGVLAKASYSQKVKNSPQFQRFQVDFTLRTNDLKSCFAAFLNSGGTMNKDVLLRETASLLGSQSTSIEFFDMLHNMRMDNDSTYAHSLNVALISRMIGTWLNFSEEELDTLTLAGLLHDIGKTKIPDEILNKETKLTDEEFALIKQHPQYGYDILKNQPLDSHVKKAALMHHERCDGSGYPMGITMNEIDDYALIISIADVYDAMTAARSYREPLCPFQVIAEFEKDGFQKYKPKYILTFLERIATTYQNNRVMLSDGRSAKIVLLNRNRLSKPLVQLDDGDCIDLDKSPLFIKSLI